MIRDQRRRLLADAVLTCRQGHRRWQTHTHRDGAFSLTLVVGSYSCSAAARNHHSSTAKTVSIRPKRISVLNFVLTAMPRPEPTATPTPMPTYTPVPTATPAGPLGGPTCAWINGAPTFNDKNALYFQTNVRADPSVVLTVAGTYPAARYAALAAYIAPAGSLVAGIPDTAFPPDPGSVNPFVAGTARGKGTYTVRIVFAKQPAQPASGTLYVDEPAGSFIVLIFRMYLPDASVTDATTWLPNVTATNVATGAQQGCPLPGTAPPNPTAFPWQSNGTPAPTTASITRLGGPQYDYYGNVDAAYLGSYLPSTNDLYVVRFKAPKTPRTLAGEPLDLSAQLRYWSVCVFDITFTAVGCVPDEQVPLDANGNATIVIGSSAAQPPSATAANGVTWIDLGSSSLPLPHSLVIRQLVPAASFPSSAFAVPVNASPGPYMGAYAPTIVTCATAQFELNRCSS